MRQKIAELINIIFGFRKFLAWVAVFMVGVVFRITSQIDGGQFVDLMKSTFLAFVAANGAEHLLTTVKEYINSKGQAVLAPVAAPNDNVVDEDAKAGG